MVEELLGNQHWWRSVCTPSVFDLEVWSDAEGAFTIVVGAGARGTAERTRLPLPFKR